MEGLVPWIVFLYVHTSRSANSRLTSLQPTLQGLDAVDALLEATPETPSYMIGIRENVITRVPLMDAVAQVRSTSRSSDLLNLMIGL